MKVVHLKTGNIYEVIGEAINATNVNDGEIVVIYQKDGQMFVREKKEFYEKFQPQEDGE
ncbi:MAG: hypothetical protein N4A76_17380 [Firmicutes bacterium]|jgi:hypothetical protein|nr:hypothetical protein [Bacillota bacterium]